MDQIPFTRKELRECVGWSDTQVRRTCDHLNELGYVGKVAGRQGATCRYVLLDTGEDDPVMEFRMGEIEARHQEQLRKLAAVEKGSK
jgi:hypothetical protein